MTDPFADQAAFMLACGQTIDKDNYGQCRLYLDLIHEEHDELLTAMTEEDQADACIDLMVVIIGYMLSRGWSADALWSEVHRSNMAKIGPSGKINYRADGKVLKPAGWTPPDIAGVIRS